MPHFPNATYKDVVAVAKKLGFRLVRTTRGSHEIWRRENDGIQTTIPNHGSKNLKRKTLASILKDFGIKPEEFSEMK